MTKLKLAGAALNQTPLDWVNNITNIKSALSAAKNEDVDILCLPELCITGYGCEDLFLSKWLAEKAFEILLDLRQEKGITFTLGLPIYYEGVLYNCACLIDQGKILGFSVKQHLANYGVHYEPRWFTAWKPLEITELHYKGASYPFGDLTYDVKGVKIAFEICEDAWYGHERPITGHAERGVELILNPSASHFAFEKTKIREDIVLEGTRKYQCGYVYANMLGNESGRMIFDGEIMIAYKDAFLKKNHLFSFKNMVLCTEEIDFAEEAGSGIKQVPANKKLDFTCSVSLALFDYMRKSKSKGFALSLSGGADSSTCAVLVSEMVRIGTEELGYSHFLEKLGFPELEADLQSLGSDNERRRKIVNCILFCVYQSSENSSEETFYSAKELATSIGANFYEWNIDQEVRSAKEKIEKVLGRKLTWERDDITLQNIQARARSPLIWMLANIKDVLLLATSNRSEGDVGYTTMDGDTSGSISPIAGVDKHFILSWLRWAETELSYPSLSSVNKLRPSAELKPLEKGQTDENDLMPFEILVKIEKLAIRDYLSPLEVFEKLQKENLESDILLKNHITKFFKLWSHHQWKRERLAPSFHLDDMNIDPKTWCRFPILSGGFQKELAALEAIEVRSEVH